jgi:hypothetical protein
MTDIDYVEQIRQRAEAALQRKLSSPARLYTCFLNSSRRLVRQSLRSCTGLVRPRPS